MSWIIGVDVGGTFTDFYMLDEASGAVHTGKRPSTPDNPARAIVDGLLALASRHGIDLAGLRRLSHGTTVGTNALIQRRGGEVVMITTSGFRDLLEIGRQTRPHMYSLVEDHPPPLVGRRRRLEIDERMGADGEAITEPAPDAVAAAVEQVRASGADACAVCLLFAFRNPEHEHRVAAALRAALPGLPVCTSFEVQPEFREYERFSTTVLNAYLQPVLGRYLSTLEETLADVAPGASIGINQSSGGLMSPERARALPVRTALSGPAAGAVGAAHVAKRAGAPRRRDSGDPRGTPPGAAHSAEPSGRRNVITLDMGGTSADVALIRDFQAGVSFERAVAGFPVRLPSVDVETVGAGGGSIAWFDRDGLLKVGPASAGADPGPACYGRGGRQPTVTDANLVLGRLPARGLLAGEMRLDASLARAAIAPIAERLGFEVERTARGMLDVVVANMVRAIRTISVERGYDPREFTLMAFGGAGPAARARRGSGPRHARDPRSRDAGHPLRAGPDRLRFEGGLRRGRPHPRRRGGPPAPRRACRGARRPRPCLVRRRTHSRRKPPDRARGRCALRRTELRARRAPRGGWRPLARSLGGSTTRNRGCSRRRDKRAGNGFVPYEQRRRCGGGPFTGIAGEGCSDVARRRRDDGPIPGNVARALP